MSSPYTDIHSQEKVINIARQIALDGFKGTGSANFESKSEFAALVSAGSELWFDTGDQAAAEKVWSSEMKGLTTNNTLVNQVIQTGALDDIIRTIGSKLKDANPVMPAESLIMEAAFILNAKLGLQLVERFGCKVSVELHPAVADDWQASVEFGKRYFAICPDNFIVKVPMTPDGFIAVRKLSEAGVPVNFTLGFSVRQNYFAAMFSRPAYVNIFLGRLGVLVRDYGVGTGDNIGEFVTWASQEAISKLRSQCPQIKTRQIAASLRSGNQVAALAGVDVLTIPPKVAEEYLTLGIEPSAITSHASSEFVPVFTKEDDKLASLWEVDDRFEMFSEECDRSAGQILTGSDIQDMAETFGVGDFLKRWTPDEQAEIKAGGKIPNYDRWITVAAPDDMMSQAALQSFAVDQAELDARIARLIG